MIAGGNFSFVAGGGATTTCTGGAATSFSLSGPTAVAVDASGRVFVADSGRRCVRMVVSGTVTNVALTGTNSGVGDNGPAVAATMRTVAGIALDATGNVFVSDSSNTAASSRVREVVGPIP